MVVYNLNHGINKLWTFVARDGPNEHHYVLHQDMLCISRVMEGWTDDPDTRPEHSKERGDRIILLNCSMSVLDMVIRYIKEEHSGERFTFPPAVDDPIFLVQLYKVALCLGLEPLCKQTIQRLQPRSIDDFIRTALEARRWDVEQNGDFLKWLTTYVGLNHSKLLNHEAFKSRISYGGPDALMLCEVFVSALAHPKQDCQSRDLSTPSTIFEPLLIPLPSSYRMRKEDLGHNAKYYVPLAEPLSSSPKIKDGPVSYLKKRKLSAYVEDASESE